ncbi:type II toxin-antitoxin system PemK/MazF family toxin [Microbacterium album]|uniref:mRNA interferase n=1 Tax=Microbacterium album TaxID=2053191 RepID=A0A917IEN1_9MICO|nr:type II toxin-antitoxin system PemK/MazF family toxin [Microbacterium album]GGH42177.1 mRNA interferase [Microbacterium album]
MSELLPGRVVWGDLDPVEGREQGGRRPLLVVSSQDHLDTVTLLVTVVPITSRDRGWSNHVRIEPAVGLPRESFAMTEQVRTIARSRVRSYGGVVAPATLAAVRMWINDFLND